MEKTPDHNLWVVERALCCQSKAWAPPGVLSMKRKFGGTADGDLAYGIHNMELRSVLEERVLVLAKHRLKGNTVKDQMLYYRPD